MRSVHGDNRVVVEKKSARLVSDEDLHRRSCGVTGGATSNGKRLHRGDAM